MPTKMTRLALSHDPRSVILGSHRGRLQALPRRVLKDCDWLTHHRVMASRRQLDQCAAAEPRSWPSFRLVPPDSLSRARSRPSSRVRVPRSSTVRGCPAVTDGLDGELARLQDQGTGGMAPLATPRTSTGPAAPHPSSGQRGSNASRAPSWSGRA